MIEQEIKNGATKYGKLTFVSVAGKSKDNHITWKMVCDCGKNHIAIASRVRSGLVKQCFFCGKKEGIENQKRHGMRKTSEYQSWLSMKQRCLNKKNKDYPNYGAKGITVCKEWIDSFESFIKDMGEKPDGYSIDRIDNTKGYYPSNCKWSSRSEQQTNKRGSRVWIVKGKTFNSMTEAADFFKVRKQTISKWVNGYFDKRRNAKMEPKNDCKQIFKY